MAGPGYGQMQPGDVTSSFNAQSFLIAQRLLRVRTNVLVKVIAITAGTGSPPTPSTVAVQPVVSMVDGQGVATPHGTIYNIPCARLQGGFSAVICDPAVGDIGLMAVSDRDISAIKSTKAVSPPGSSRVFDLADGVYLMTLFGQTPTQYVSISELGIKLADGHGNVIETKSDGIHFTGKVFMSADLTVASGASLAVGGNVTVDGGIAAQADITTAADMTCVAMRASADAIAAGAVSLVGHAHRVIVPSVPVTVNTGAPI